MTRTDFLASLDQILDLPSGSLKGDEKLEDLETWDSTAMISFIALADEHNSARLSPRQIGACQTVNDLLALAQITS